MVLESALLSSYGLLGLFIVTFLSYSIIPMPSEAAIVISAIVFGPVITFLVAFAGSTAGTLTNYYLGAKGARRLTPKKQSKIKKRANKLFEKYGSISLLFFSWLPIIGDPLTIIAGGFRMRLWKFILYTSIGKGLYIIATIALGHSIFSGLI